MTETAARARSIGSTAARILNSSRAGRVAASFSRCVYLEFDAGVAALVAPDLLNGPLNVVLDGPRTVPFPDIPPGQAVQAAADAITIGDGIRVETAEARVWPAELRPWSAGDVRRACGCIAMIEGILTEAPGESFAHAEGRPRRAAEAMSLLAEGIGAGETRRTETAVERLAGLGPGLTPSGDDVLAGAMIAISLAGTASSGLRSVIYRSAAGRTTRISEAYLETASRGEAGEAWHRLRNAISSAPNAPPSAALEMAARRLLTFGETSGADMLAGFILALRALGGG